MAAATYQLYRITKTVLGLWRLLDSTSAVADLVCYLPDGIKVLPGSLPCILLVPRCADLALRRAGAQAALLATASHTHSERHIFHSLEAPGFSKMDFNSDQRFAPQQNISSRMNIMTDFFWSGCFQGCFFPRDVDVRSQEGKLPGRPH